MAELFEPLDPPSRAAARLRSVEEVAGRVPVRRPVNDALLIPTRRKAGRGHDRPTAGSIDSSTAKAPEGEDRGFDGGQRTRGRERHEVVDALGLLLAPVVTGARADDAKAVPAVFRQLPPEKYPRSEKLWADAECHNHGLNHWLANTYTGRIKVEGTRRADDDPHLAVPAGA